ncbi:MAG: hypothetical protein KGL91_06265 [Xanthomonadaceae bacterium]|nr:hypothetical protein [Xanthomonadaceae bacterium]
MHTFIALPSQFHWTSSQLADAVPRRLHQHAIFRAGAQTAAANDARASATRASSYLPAPTARSPFRIR